MRCAAVLLRGLVVAKRIAERRMGSAMAHLALDAGLRQAALRRIILSGRGQKTTEDMRLVASARDAHLSTLFVKDTP